MAKFLKISGFCVLLSTAIFFFLFLPGNRVFSAQENVLPVLVCDEPIPIGEVFEDTAELLNSVYREIQSARGYLESAIKEVQTEIGELYKGGDEVCDFSVCYPQILDQAPDLKIKINYFLGSQTLTSIHIPFCMPQSCIGNPCPDLDSYINDLKSLKSAVEGSRQIIHDIFTVPSVLAGENLRIKSGANKESPTALLTKPEAVKRKIKLSREWLHSSSEIGKKTCSLTESEKKKILQGEIGDRYPLKCVEALSEGIYWPKMWSEECSVACEGNSPEKCAACLANPLQEGASVLAKINFKIYNTCGSVCENGLEKDCINCLCSDENGNPLSEKECVAWICGGSYYNYTCCHEVPLDISPEIWE